MRPHVDFAQKQVVIVHNGTHYKLPTCIVSSSGSTRGELSCVNVLSLGFPRT